MNKNLFMDYSHLVLSILTGTLGVQNSEIMMDAVLLELELNPLTRGMFTRIPLITTGAGKGGWLLNVSRSQFNELRFSNQLLGYHKVGDVGYGITLSEVQKVFRKEKHPIVLAGIEVAISAKNIFQSDVFTIACQTKKRLITGEKKKPVDLLVTYHEDESVQHIEYVATGITEKVMNAKKVPTIQLGCPGEYSYSSFGNHASSVVLSGAVAA
jgi:hypothetical protein